MQSKMIHILKGWKQDLSIKTNGFQSMASKSTVVGWVFFFKFTLQKSQIYEKELISNQPKTIYWHKQKITIFILKSKYLRSIIHLRKTNSAVGYQNERIQDIWLW
jgi:hypothetical protein